ncbi:MAG: WXG100 family type VII secretion target [Lachnospiraceae bacterium]
MANVTLKVSTDVMKAKADEIKTQAKNIETNWERMKEVVNNSKTYWEGDASDYHRRYLKDNEDDVKKIIKRLNEHPKDLLSMAGIYSETEKQAAKIASALPDDVIV